MMVAFLNFLNIKELGNKVCRIQLNILTSVFLTICLIMYFWPMMPKQLKLWIYSFTFDSLSLEDLNEKRF